MKLETYLKKVGKRPRRWAVENGLSPSTVWRALKMKGRPTLETIRLIRIASNDAVRPDDWFGGETG